MKNILAAVDFSTVTEKVLRQAADLARAQQAKLWVLHAAAPEPDFVGYHGGYDDEREVVADHLREDHRKLGEMAERLRAEGIEAEALHIQGPTVDVILTQAEKLSADLIVMGSHGHGAVARLLVGSSSEGVLRGATMPVLVIPMDR